MGKQFVSFAEAKPKLLAGAGLAWNYIKEGEHYFWVHKSTRYKLMSALELKKDVHGAWRIPSHPLVLEAQRKAAQRFKKYETELAKRKAAHEARIDAWAERLIAAPPAKVRPIVVEIWNEGRNS